MTVEYAKTTDIAQLTELRLAYLEADHGKLCEDDINKIKQALIAACAFLLVVEKPNSPAFITGKTGIVLNVYTKSLHRHKGYAKTIINQILEEAV